MKKLLAIGALGALATVSLTGCVKEKSYSDYLLEEQVKCSEAGGHVEVYKDRYMMNGKRHICILPGTEIHLEKDK